MALITLSASSGFTLIPEGTHIFKVTGVTYKKLYGKMEVYLETKEGLKHTERYSLMDKNGQDNQGVLNAFSYFAKCALNNFDATDIDTDDLIGRYIECEVTHDVQPKQNGKPGETITFIRLGNKAPASGFEDEEAEEPAAEDAAPAPAEDKPKYDIDSLLG